MTRVTSVGLGAAIVGAIGMVAGVLLDPRQALTSYLFAYATVFTVILGALIMVMMSYASGAQWFAALSHLALAIVGAIPALVVLAIPILLGLRDIYPWATPASLSAGARVVVERKGSVAQHPVLRRAGAAVSRGVAHRGRARETQMVRAREGSYIRSARPARRSPERGRPDRGRTDAHFRMVRLADALEPTWYSTVYGVYVFAGGFLAVLAVIAMIAPRATHGLGAEQTSALGKLIVTFTIFWAYIAFSQYLIIWIGDLPAEVSWYVVRARGSWGVSPSLSRSASSRFHFCCCSHDRANETRARWLRSARSCS